MITPKTWQRSFLGNHIEIRQEKLNPQKLQQEYFYSIGLEHIESQTGRILSLIPTKGENIRSIKNKFYSGDILYGKLRPNLNKVSLVDQEGICSTDILVLICNESIIPKYAECYLRSIFVLKRVEQLAVGGQLPRLNAKDLLKIPIFIPSIAEQKYIVEILQQAEEIQQLRRCSLEKYAKLTSVLFLEMFGNILSNEKNWKTEPLGLLCELVRGSSPRPKGDTRYYGGNVPRLMVADLTRDGVYVAPKIDTLTEEGAKKSRPMEQGSVVMAVSGAPGLAAILSIDACIHDGFVGFRNLDERLLPEFFVGVLEAMKVMNERQAVGAVFLNLKTQQIRAWNIPIPPPKLQKQYVERFKEIHIQLNNMAGNHEIINKFLFQVSVSAFTGSLTKSWRKEDYQATVHSTQPITINTLLESVKGFYNDNRNWLFNQLSHFQQHILSHIKCKDIYITSNMLEELLDDSKLLGNTRKNKQEILKRTLEQLAALGSINKVSIPNSDDEYIIAYHRLREDDNSKTDDLSILQSMENT